MIEKNANNEAEATLPCDVQQQDAAMACAERLSVPATLEHLPEIVTFLEDKLDACHAPVKVKRRFLVAADEILANIISYAYPDIPGPMEIEACAQPCDGESAGSDGPGALSVLLTVSFADGGVPFDPLTAEDPDVNASIDDRAGGGYGIMIVRSFMDDVSYERRNGKNVLTISKLISFEQE